MVMVDIYRSQHLNDDDVRYRYGVDRIVRPCDPSNDVQV